jgi:hypothetical protein
VEQEQGDTDLIVLHRRRDRPKMDIDFFFFKRLRQYFYARTDMEIECLATRDWWATLQFHYHTLLSVVLFNLPNTSCGL